MLLFLFIFTGTVQSKLLILPNLLRRLSKHVLRIEEISVCSPPQCDSVPFSLTRNHLSVQLVWSYCYRRLLSVIMSWFFGKTLRSMGRKMNQTTYIWLCPSEVMTLYWAFQLTETWPACPLLHWTWLSTAFVWIVIIVFGSSIHAFPHTLKKYHRLYLSYFL